MSICDGSNIEFSLNVLSGELDVLGYKEIADENVETLVIQLINVCHSLCGDIKKKSLKVNRQAEEIGRLINNNANLEKEKMRLNNHLQRENEKYLKLQDTYIETNNTKDTFQVEVSKLKSEIARLMKAISVQNLNHEHELRRKDNLISSLTSKLDSVDIKPIQRQEIKQHSNSSLMEKYACTLNNNIQFLISENADIRSCLLKIYKEVLECRNLFCDEKTNVRNYGHIFLHLPGPELLIEIERDFIVLLNDIKCKLSKNICIETNIMCS